MKYILILILLCSCGTRKADTQHRDSIYIENSYSQGTKVVLGNTFTYKPFDSLKPMFIEGKEYVNVIITNDKTKIIEKWKNRYITKTVTIAKTKKTEKSDYTILWIFIALIIVGAIWLWFYLPKMGKIPF